MTTIDVSCSARAQCAALLYAQERGGEYQLLEQFAHNHSAITDSLLNSCVIKYTEKQKRASSSILKTFMHLWKNFQSIRLLHHPLFLAKNFKPQGTLRKRRQNAYKQHDFLQSKVISYWIVIPMSLGLRDILHIFSFDVCTLELQQHGI